MLESVSSREAQKQLWKKRKRLEDGDTFCSLNLTSEHLDMKMNLYLAALSLLPSLTVSLNTPANILFRLFSFSFSCDFPFQCVTNIFYLN